MDNAIIVEVDKVIVILFGSVFLSGVLYVIAERRMIKILKREFPEEWRSLGSPDWSNQSVRTMRSMLRFILSSEYRKLDNSELERRVGHVKFFGSLTLIVGSVMVLLSALYSFLA